MNIVLDKKIGVEMYCKYISIPLTTSVAPATVVVVAALVTTVVALLGSGV